MSKRFHGHLYDTVESWHPVIIRQKGNFMDDIALRPAWLSEHCPDGPDDYDAWVYGDDNLMDSNHRSIYFFRDERVAMLFTLRWA